MDSMVQISVTVRTLFLGLAILVLSSCGLLAQVGLSPRYVVNPNPTSPTPVAAQGGTTGLNANPITPTEVPNLPGYEPLDLRNLYHVQAQPYTGEGVTLCLIEAYQNQQAITDSNFYANTFKLPVPKTTLVDVTGHAEPDPPSVNWHVETTLDIDMVMSVAPNATILILEAATANGSDLQAAVEAVPKYGCSIVSMSYGGAAQNNEASLQGDYELPGVAFFASSGDSLGSQNYPALEPGVVSVGGTKVAVNGTTITESVWTSTTNESDVGEGEGLSSIFPAPSFEKGFNSNAFNQAPQVAAIADPDTGVAIYSEGAWVQVGGTSVASPVWAAVTALVDEGRTTNQLAAIQDLHQAIFTGLASIESTAFRDVTSGQIGNVSAGVGYDALSGFGTPMADEIVQYLTSSTALGTSVLTKFAPATGH
jgi:subtilase family serine protease